MALSSLSLVQPTTVAEASEALVEFADRAKIYAGGAELLLLLRHGLLQTEVLIDVKKIARLHRVAFDDGALKIGACVTHRELETNPIIRRHASSFAYAESQVANARVRNQGTVGGNLCFNDPHSDPATVLLVHDASVTVGNRSGERQIPLSNFLVGMYATALEPDEILLDIRIPALPAGMKSVYRRVHRYQRPTLGVAVAAKTANGTIEATRVAVGCVGPEPVRLVELEAKLKGADRAEAVKMLPEEKNYIRDLLRPVDDLLGSAEYKLYITCQLLREALEGAAQQEGKDREETP
jgi:aerobic carbon-monoxide dehydrogenase medium subunit